MSGGMARLQPRVAQGGRSRLRDETFRVLSHRPVAFTRSAGHPLSMVAMGRLGSGGATPMRSSKGAGTQGRRIRSRRLAAGRLEKSRVSGQTDGLCSAPGSGRTVSEWLPSREPCHQSTSATVAVSDEVLPLSGWTT